MEIDEILLGSSGSSPVDPAFWKKLEQGESIRTDESEESFLPDWIKPFLFIIAIITIIAVIIGLCALFFISPMATLIIVAMLIMNLIMLGFIVDGP